MLLRLMMMIDMLMMMLVSWFHLSLFYLFSTLPLMTRVRRFNARKDCLMCIIGVIAGGHYDQGRDSECKAHYYYFYSQQFCLRFWSAWLHINTDVMMMTAIMIVICWWWWCYCCWACYVCSNSIWACYVCSVLREDYDDCSANLM